MITLQINDYLTPFDHWAANCADLWGRSLADTIPAKWTAETIKILKEYPEVRAVLAWRCLNFHGLSATVLYGLTARGRTPEKFWKDLENIRAFVWDWCEETELHIASLSIQRVEIKNKIYRISETSWTKDVPEQLLTTPELTSMSDEDFQYYSSPDVESNIEYKSWKKIKHAVNLL